MFYVTDNIDKPKRNEAKDMITAAGGKVLDNDDFELHPKGSTPGKVLVISGQMDSDKAKELADLGFTVSDVEDLLTSVLQQQVVFTSPPQWLESPPSSKTPRKSIRGKR
mmetsp:Transcript_9129/g.15614  ORF Transcript_9129/g.15614 Transcript_9129/m.15614 type:complete len:109 (-) Transcript_9129:416-742(-)